MIDMAQRLCASRSIMNKMTSELLGSGVIEFDPPLD
jgi:hypothetical protein